MNASNQIENAECKSCKSYVEDINDGFDSSSSIMVIVTFLSSEYWGSPETKSSFFSYIKDCNSI